MKNGFGIRFLWYLSGILFVFVGGLALFHPKDVITGMSFLLGMVMVLVGAFNLFIYFKWNKYLKADGWVLADGLITVLMGIAILCNQWIAASIIPFLFSTWIIFSGVSKITSCMEMNEYGVPKWQYFTILGLIEIVIGFLSLFDPITTSIAVGLIVGAIFIVKGVTMVIDGVMIRRVIKELE